MKSLKAELIRKLKGLKDEASGEVGITEIYDADQIYHGPYKSNAPDLIIGYNQGYRASWDSVTGKVNSVVFEDNTKAWSGDHCIDPKHVPGVFFSTLRIRAKAPSIMDIAPTVLKLFGLPVPTHMNGLPLVEAVEHKTPKKGKKE